MGRLFLTVVSLLVLVSRSIGAQPVTREIFPLDQLQAGQRGEVWTVFRGTEPEPFAVEVTGVVRNALGPGKSLILCQLTDPRVQLMGAVAGMSGSPLYIDGKLAGALSYQIQRFETVRFAGFTPAADLVEVQTKMAAAAARSAPPIATLDGEFRPLRPVFTLSGLSPAVADLFAPRFAALGLSASALGG
ncbi:MAG: SpoIVB peptidase S55 domain-containing protein, partial [Opitutus sp.]